VRLGVAFGWHTFAWEDLAALVERAEELGYAAAYVDGDVSTLGVRRQADVLDGWTVTTALIARTRRIPIGSLRLVEHWNAARLAQAAATLERIAPGRLRFFASIGDRREDHSFGYPRTRAAERIERLDETLTAARALWRGESVTLDGAHVRLDGARVRPVPVGGRISIEIAAKGAQLLGVVARHADVWNVNLPPPRPFRAGRGAPGGRLRLLRTRSEAHRAQHVDLHESGGQIRAADGTPRVPAPESVVRRSAGRGSRAGPGGGKRRTLPGAPGGAGARLRPRPPGDRPLRHGCGGGAEHARGHPRRGAVALTPHLVLT
jgi:alkanesulfonate monooxygenase SsuD/methylene tetrahydromethanopterin reductase-like flavin-dependent oxidoreductase (luciferase family)